MREFHCFLLGEVMLCVLIQISYREATTWRLSPGLENVIVDALLHQTGTSMGDIDGRSRYRDTEFTSLTDILHRLQVDDLCCLCDPTKNPQHNLLEDRFVCLKRIDCAIRAHLLTPLNNNLYVCRIILTSTLSNIYVSDP